MPKIFIIILFALSASFKVQAGTILLKNSDDVERTSQLKKIPITVDRNAIRLYPKMLTASNWQVLREWPNGEIRIFLKKNGNLFELNFPRGSSVLVNLILESSGDLYIFSYDVESNIPSGRGLKSVSEGIALWHFSFESEQVTQIASNLPLGGVDNILQARVSDNNVDVCTLNKCLRIGANKAIESWSHPILIDHEIVEIKFSEKNAYALLRRAADHVTGNPDYSLPPFKIVSLPYPGTNRVSFTYLVADDCLPFRLQSENGIPNWSCAKTPSELAEVFKGDIQRIPHSGLGDLGLNNSEGRIAWSLVYSLNALLYLNKFHTPKIAANLDWNIEKLFLRDALELIARQGIDTELGYSSRRYSQNRTPLLFALHLGRILQLLSDSKFLGHGSNNITKALISINKEMRTLNSTAEMRTTLDSYSTLAYRKGIDFWADGSNVPYNYISGYVHGFLSTRQHTEDEVLEMKNLLLPLIENEISSNSNHWNYWWGHGTKGWSRNDSISSNTPEFSGSSGTAHISYRSMDAMAVLRLAKIKPSIVDQKVLDKIRYLISNGYLLPFVNQETIESGGSVKINRKVALYYARSASPTELHAQLFALESLADK